MGRAQHRKRRIQCEIRVPLQPPRFGRRRCRGIMRAESISGVLQQVDDQRRRDLLEVRRESSALDRSWLHETSAAIIDPRCPSAGSRPSFCAPPGRGHVFSVEWPEFVESAQRSAQQERDLKERGHGARPVHVQARAGRGSKLGSRPFQLRKENGGSMSEERRLEKGGCRSSTLSPVDADDHLD